MVPKLKHNLVLNHNFLSLSLLLLPISLKHKLSILVPFDSFLLVRADFITVDLDEIQFGHCDQTHLPDPFRAVAFGDNCIFDQVPICSQDQVIVYSQTRLLKLMCRGGGSKL